MNCQSWIGILVVLIFAAPAAAEEQPFKSPMDKVNYGIGVEVVRNFKNQGLDVDLDRVIQGMKDGLSGNIQISEKELRKIMTEFQTELRQRQVGLKKLAAQNNLKKSELFFAENRTKEGVVALPSGLQYKIIKAGTGKIPTENDTIECHYRGTLLNGTEFDSSYKSGKPLVAELSQGLIPGWKEALKLMPDGSKWQLFIPPQLAYGERGTGLIEPNEPLILEVELLAIK